MSWAVLERSMYEYIVLTVWWYGMLPAGKCVVWPARVPRAATLLPVRPVRNVRCFSCLSALLCLFVRQPFQSSLLIVSTVAPSCN